MTLRLQRLVLVFGHYVLIKAKQLESKVDRNSPHYRWLKAHFQTHPRQRTATTLLLVLFITSILMPVFVSASNVNKTWDFSNPANYTTGDSTSLEYSGSSIRLKAQNYSTDANTAGLYHFDEASGSSAADSSANANTATVTSPSFVTGNLNNGLSLNGTTSRAQAADSASLSLSQANTVESWTKLNSSFAAGSTAGRQTVADKGAYSLYYDDQTGKAVYELQKNTTNNWSQVAGNSINNSWDSNGKDRNDSSVAIGTDLYVGTGSLTPGDAEVWKQNSSGAWTKIAGDGLNGSWAANTYENVNSMTTDGTNLYVGTGVTAGDGEVWKWNGSTWSQIGGDGLLTSWAGNTYEQVASLSYYGGNLYAGLGVSAGDAEVWRYNGTSWTQIGGDGLSSSWSIASNTNKVNRLENDGTNLYAMTGSATASAGMGDVWKYNGSTWSQIGGDGLNSSWTASTYEDVLSSFFMGSNLYVGLGTSVGDAEVWRWSGSAWTKLASSGVGFPASTYEGVYSLSGDGTNLYAGTGRNGNNGDVWKYNGSTWSQIGGDGLNSGFTGVTNVTTMAYVNSKLYASGVLNIGTNIPMYSWNGTGWQPEGGQYYNGSWGFNGFNMTKSLVTSNGKMYAGMGSSTAGGAVVYEYNGSTWRQIGGNGTNSSWPFGTYTNVYTMASLNGGLAVGLEGSAAGDAEVWTWNGATWTKIGGDLVNSSWASTPQRLTALTSNAGVLYAAMGGSGGPADVWKYQSGSWTKIGGSAITAAFGAYRYINTLNFFQGDLIAGSLGSGANTGDLWKYSGGSWTQIGGDGLNSGWSATTILEANAISTYRGEMYVGTGGAAGDGDIWKWNGSSWTQVAGDAVNSSWGTLTYERVRSMSVYNGELYAGLGTTNGNGEVWKYNGTTWSQVGGDSLNAGWTNASESVPTMTVYRGKLYAGTGDSTNLDAAVYSYGDNGYLESSTSTFDTSWRHLAGTYDGTTMKLYINGALDASTAASLSMPDTATPLMIGTGQGSTDTTVNDGSFNGLLDELRISNTARTSFTTKPYTNQRASVSLTNPDYTSGIATWDNFTSAETLNGGSIAYRFSDDGGTTWKFWNGSAWAASSGLADSNSAATAGLHIDAFAVGSGGFTWQAVLLGDGTQRVQLDSVSLAATSDTTPPAANATNLIMKQSPSGATINDGAWTNADQPYFSWTPANDTQSAIKGYCLYLGTDNTADPVTTKGMLGTSPVTTHNDCQFIVSGTNLNLATSGYLASALASSNSTYYLKIKALDNAGNVYNGTSASASFKFDNTAPVNPAFISAPSQFVSTKQVTITWPTANSSAASDAHSGVAGLQYKIGSNGTWYGDGHSGAQDSTDLLTDDGSYQTTDPPDYANLSDGNNTIYFRTYDAAGNVSAVYTTGVIRINTTSPTGPQNLQATPPTNTSNSFAFSWQPPATFGGSASNITYCYSVNTLPTSGTCTYTAAGVTSLPAGAFATQPGDNTFYVVAKDEAGNVNYATAANVTFTANTSAPGIPLNVDVVDISVKSSSNWRLALSWDVPTDTGAGIAAYKVYRSTDDISYTNVASTAGTSYVDGGLSQQKYYYKIRACDSANNCGAYTTPVSQTPTGKYTTAAGIINTPKVSGISTRKATISWATDRQSDSRIQYGVKTGEYFSTEAAISAQVTDHEVLLNNLTAGTTYFYKAKWTDEDGNTGQSAELSFKTAAAPVVKEVDSKPTLTGATLSFTSKDASSAKIYYGKSEGFGGVKSINTSLSESQYSAVIDGLDDGTKYFFKINTLDSDGNEYEGNVYSFTTPPRPKITNLRFQPVPDQPSSTQKVSWDTNVASTSELNYGVQKLTQNISDSTLKTSHELTLTGLSDDSTYILVAQSRDGNGNLATSDQQVFKTSLDTRPPKISNVTIDTSIRGTGADARGQVVISWKTDEPSTSQVGYGDGSSGFLSSLSSEDAKLTTDHVVVVSDLSTSRVFHFEPRSYDKGRNLAKGTQQIAIVGRASDNVLSIIFNALQKIFGIK